MKWVVVGELRDVLIGWGLRRRGMTGKYGKVGVKRKWWVLAQVPYSVQGNGRQSH